MSSNPDKHNFLFYLIFISNYISKNVGSLSEYFKTRHRPSLRWPSGDVTWLAHGW